MVAAEPTNVIAGTGPKDGKPAQRGYHVAVTMKEAAKSARLVHLLVPLDLDAKPPTVRSEEGTDRLTLTIDWDGKTEVLTLATDWKSTGAGDAGPATFKGP